MKIKKLTMTACFVCLGFVLSTFVVFPNMAPFQHFINVICAVVIGPWYGLLAAFTTGLLRIFISGRTVLAILGGVFGALLAGLAYRYTKKMWMAVIGEIIGTGLIAAVISEIGRAHV